MNPESEMMIEEVNRRAAESSSNFILDLLAQQNEKLDRMDETMHLIVRGFPKDQEGDPDPDGHRRYHEAVISRMEKRAAFYEKMLTELTKYGLLGFFAWFCWVMGHGLLDYMQKITK